MLAVVEHCHIEPEVYNQPPEFDFGAAVPPVELDRDLVVVPLEYEREALALAGTATVA